VSERKSGDTRTGVVAGTPEYMSPEHAQGFRAGPASDVWSLGVVLFECITGYRPFESESIVGVLMSIVTQPIPSLLNCDYVPKPIAEVVARTLVRDPAERFPDGAAFRDALAIAGNVEFVPSRSRSVPPKILHDSGEISLSGAHRVEARQSSPSLTQTPAIKIDTPRSVRVPTPNPVLLPMGVAIADSADEPAFAGAADSGEREHTKTVDSLAPIMAVTPIHSMAPPSMTTAGNRRRYALPAALLLAIAIAIAVRLSLTPTEQTATAPRLAGESGEPGASGAPDTASAPSAFAVQRSATEPAMLRQGGGSVRGSEATTATAARAEMAAPEGHAAPASAPPSRNPSLVPQAGASSRGSDARDRAPEMTESRRERTPRVRGSSQPGVQRGANGSLILD
jgi:hypothetical protein